MNDKNLLDAMGNIDPKLIMSAAPDAAQKKLTEAAWVKWIAIAACFCLIVSAVVVIPMLLKDDYMIVPYMPNGDPWTPVIHADVNEVILSADEVGGVFDVTYDSIGTNQYTKIYTVKPEYLNLIPLPNAEYLPVYSSSTLDYSQDELQKFINTYIDVATAFFGVNSKSYQIESEEGWDSNIYYEAKIKEDKKGIFFIAKDNLLYFRYYNVADDRLKLRGSMVSIMESDTDAQIKEKLSDTISYVCTFFGKEYSDVKIYRNYSYEQLKYVTIYLYSAQKTVFPSNFSQSPMTSDYITLTFYTDWGSGTGKSWGGSKDEAFLSNVALYETIQNPNNYYTVDAKAKMLTLEQAEALLAKGYVFGGHSCSLCMEGQPEMDFSDYTYADVEYVSDVMGKLCIPFYAFYKYIGTTEHGIDTYAKTYVPAVQVSGYDEYFESQKENHRSKPNAEYAD